MNYIHLDSKSLMEYYSYKSSIKEKITNLYSEIENYKIEIKSIVIPKKTIKNYLALLFIFFFLFITLYFFISTLIYTSQGKFIVINGIPISEETYGSICLIIFFITLIIDYLLINYYKKIFVDTTEKIKIDELLSKIEKNKQQIKTELEDLNFEYDDDFERIFNVDTDSVFSVNYMNGIPLFDKTLKSQPKNNSFYLWKDNINLFFLHSDRLNCIGKFLLPINNIAFFCRVGDLLTNNIISGGGSSIPNALIGAAIAGSEGAIIASREKISSKIEINDKRFTLIKIVNEIDDQFACMVLNSEAYDFLLKLLPHKEIGISNNQSTNKSDDTKECPFCAEIIKQKAKFCRFCNHELSK